MIVLRHFQAITTIGTNGQLTSGKFITQSAGTYKFQFYALTQNNTNVWLELYKNNDIVASVFAHSYGDYAATGNGVVLQLKTGDEVYVWTRSNYNTALYGGADQIYTTFTGVYLGKASDICIFFSVFLCF